MLMATTSGPISTTGQSSLATPTTPEEGTGGMGTSSSSSDEPSTTDIIGINDQGFQLGECSIEKKQLGEGYSSFKNKIDSATKGFGVRVISDQRRG